MMFVCSCRGVDDRTVRKVIEDGAKTISEVARRCGAGSQCGGCWPTIEKLLDEDFRRRLKSATSASSAA